MHKQLQFLFVDRSIASYLVRLDEQFFRELSKYFSVKDVSGPYKDCPYAYASICMHAYLGWSMLQESNWRPKWILSTHYAFLVPSLLRSTVPRQKW